MAKTMTIIAAVVVTATFAGCIKIENDENIDNTWLNHGRQCATKVIEVEGHKYILMDGFKSGGIIHAASCECMDK